jgi:hypothetical protein
MQTAASASSYWTGLAQCYDLLGPPLRPSQEDVQVFESAVRAQPRHRRALLLGVTPDIVRMRLPERCSLVAMDRSWPMVRAVAPRDRPAVCADWLALPIRPYSCDIVLGDGSLSMVDPQRSRRMAEAIHSALHPDGTLILRCYFQPSVQENPDGVFAELRRGLIPSFHHFKLRLLMAMQPDFRQGVAVHQVWDRWRRERVDPSSLPAVTAWQPPVVAMMEHYRDTDTVYWFPTLTEFRSVIRGVFAEVSLTIPAGNLAERCPILVLKPK